jgi:phosphoglycerate dehydrogenase-like enzyme
VNVARGAVVDTKALLAEVESGRISAALDVTDPEPLPPGHPLFELPNVLITPHLAGAQGRELRRLGEFAVTELERLLAGDPLRGQVLPEQLPYTA